MNNGEILKKTIECFDNIGIITEGVVGENDKLIDLIEDSLSFITFIVEVEQIFDVELDSDFLILEEWETFGDAVAIIKDARSKVVCDICI